MAQECGKDSVMSASAPEVSFIIPVFNLENYIEDCLDSVLAQTFQDFELIIVDDGSTDRTVEICRKYQQQDCRIILLHNDHQGVGAARNAGLQASRGEFIAFVDGDDTLHPQYLKVLTGMLEDPETDITGVTFREVKTNGRNNLRELHRELPAMAPIQVVGGVDLVSRMFNTMQFQTLWGKLYRRTLIENHRYGPFGMGGDVPFNSEVYLEARKFSYSDTPLYFRLVRPNSICFSTFGERNFDEIRSIHTACLNMERYGEAYKAEGLKKLYKVIPSVGLRATKEYRRKYKSIKKDIIHQTRKEFLRSPHISTKFKAALWTFNSLPFTYRLFRLTYEKLNR